MRIGIDIDGVLTDLEHFCLDYISKYCVCNNIDFDISFRDYCFANNFNIADEVEDRFWDEYMKVYEVEERIRPFASEVIQKLKEEGNEIFIVTARYDGAREDEVGEHVRTVVKNWLKKYNVQYDNIIFTKGANEQKLAEILDNKIELMIEDNPSNVGEISQHIPVLCYDAGYNKGCKGKNIFRVYSWYDIYSKLNKICKIN